MEPIEGPIRWGIAGTGAIAAAFVRDFPRAGDPTAEIVAVGSRTAATADGFAARHGIARSHGSYEALAADPDVDVVYVAGIHPVHAPQTVRFLDAGKHVLVEKPMALNAAEVDRMIAAARAGDRFLMEAMWMRFNPLHVEVMRRVRAGEIGEPRRVVADFSIPVPAAAGHRLWEPALGGGALLDVGIYPFTLAWMVFDGPPERVDHTAHVQAGVDAEISMLARFPGGGSALLSASVRVGGSLTARIDGTDGSIELPAPAHCCDRATIRRGAAVDEIVAEPAGLHHQVTEVHDRLRRGERESQVVPWSTSRRVIAAFDSIRAEIGVIYDADRTDGST